MRASHERRYLKEDGNGKERKRNAEKTGHQVSQFAKEVAEGQEPDKAGQEEVR
jgi:hypothetical protein